MKNKFYAKTYSRRAVFYFRMVAVLALLGLLIGQGYDFGTLKAQAAPTATNHMTLAVVSARTEPAHPGGGVTKGDPITTYKYIINIDNTGTTTQRLDPLTGALPSACTPADPGYPDSCQWVSVAGAASHSPIYASGDQNDFIAGLDLPNGRYLISVLADGYKLDGTPFTVPFTGSGLVTVELQPHPLPTGTIQAEIFEDNASTNSAPDVPAERGLAGFVGHISDYIDEVTTNVFGDPLCGGAGMCVSKCYVVNNAADIGTVAPIDAMGRCPIGFTNADDPLVTGTITQTLEGTPIPTGAVIEGKLKIPDVGPNRYALSAVPPNGSGWIQTTTLEGNHDWDAWVMEGATGLDTEFTQAGEPFPGIFFGYVQPTNKLTAPKAGKISGVVAYDLVYIPLKGGVGTGTIFGGFMGNKIDQPGAFAWVSLSDLNAGDTTIYVGQADQNGKFTINNVPDGDYSLAYWDEPQDYILNLFNVTVRNGETVDLGVIPLNGWWTTIRGHIFNDLNANGKMDAGEPGLAGFPVTMKKRENSVMDRGAITVNTDAEGYYFMENAYPITQWLVEEVYSDLYYTTGVTFQADNQPTETTILGQGVDVNVLPIIGLGGRLDWGVRAYDKGTNGGIVGTVSYDTTRNELDPRYAAVENWQPGVSDIPVKLYEPTPCPRNPTTGEITGGAVCDSSGRYQLDTDGSFMKGKLVNSYMSETWQRPTGCVARDMDGIPMTHGVDENSLPTNPNAGCIEAPLQSVQFGPMATDQGTPAANFGATVDGNYGFGDGCFNGTLDDTDPSNPICVGGTFDPLPPNDYLVSINIPNDALGRPMYKVTKEEDINIFNGDQWVPQVPPPACVGALHTVDLANSGGPGKPVTDNYPAQSVAFPGGSILVPASTPVDNQPYADAGGSYYDGQAKPLCDTKLVTVSDRKSIAPSFNIFTDVPVAGRFWGLLVDDLNYSTDKRSLLYGEKAGIPFAPVGIYDYTNRLVATVETDFNGLYDVLLPSTDRISCPTPSGVCANLYRFVGNDPGTPGKLNLNYNPQFRTIAAEFEAFPGLIVPADNAPVQVGVSVQLPGGQINQALACPVNDAANGAVPVPEFYAIDKPYVTAGANTTFTIKGSNFGATQGQVLFNTTTNNLMNVTSWTDTQIQFQVPNSIASTKGQLLVKSANGKTSINGLTFHVLSTNNSGYSPTVFEVGPGLTGVNKFNPTTDVHAIQHALDAAAALPQNVQNRGALVVVYPNLPDLVNPRNNPRGAYYENLVMYSPVKLQGVGPGSADGSVRGSILDGSAIGGDTTLADDWRTLVGSLSWVGDQNVYEGQVVYVLARTTNQYGSRFNAAVDGFDIRGGDQTGFPANINEIGGGGPTGLPAAVVTQGGAIFANGYARYLQITNNIVQNNGGSYGTIRIGSPNLPQPLTDQQNDFTKISYNRIIANAGTNLAGAIGIFAGAQNYEVSNNDICGNFSAEYGGGISHLGYSPNGSIHDNRIYFNESYDEGAGVFIAGELPANTAALSQGSGPVSVYNNLIQGNLANDDGGGLRFLMAGNYPINVYNNMIVNNVSAHEGGGIALDDTPKARIYNNTIMKNTTTATAITSSGIPAPAGISTAANSVMLQATLPGGSPTFSNPILFNNIFWDNRAGLRSSSTVLGIGLASDLGPVNHWDLGTADASGLLEPTNSILQSTNGTVASVTNLSVDPQVTTQYDTNVAFQPWRTNPNFIGALLVAQDVPPSLLGNYHLANTSSPANNAGASGKVLPTYQRPPNNLASPTFDYDNEGRPASGAFDIGADEIPVRVDLAVTKTDGVTTVVAGSAVNYTIVATNNGPDAASAARVVDLFPSSLTGITWTCSATAGSSCPASGSGNINTTANLAVGGSATFVAHATVSPSASGTLLNSVLVSQTGATDTNSANNTAQDFDTITSSADLSITKSNGVNAVNRTSLTTYSIVVTNNGPSSVTGATVNDTFSNIFSAAPTWSCSATSGSSCVATNSGSSYAKSGTVTLLPGGSATFTAVALVSSTTTASSVSNTATVTSPANSTDSNTANNTATDTDTIQTVHIGDLDWSSAPIPATATWRATVTITVHDANHNPVSNWRVTGAWNHGDTSGRTLTCVTNASGQCSVTSGTLSNTGNPDVSFTVSSVAFATTGQFPFGLTPYLSSANHDPDAAPQNSNGTVVTATKP